MVPDARAVGEEEVLTAWFMRLGELTTVVVCVACSCCDVTATRDCIGAIDAAIIEGNVVLQCIDGMMPVWMDDILPASIADKPPA